MVFYPSKADTGEYAAFFALRQSWASQLLNTRQPLQLAYYRPVTPLAAPAPPHLTYQRGQTPHEFQRRNLDVSVAVVPGAFQLQNDISRAIAPTAVPGLLRSLSGIILSALPASDRSRPASRKQNIL
jgi:hypothetical protein